MQGVVREIRDGMLLFVDVAPGHPRLFAGPMPVRVIESDRLEVCWPGVLGSLGKDEAGNWRLHWYDAGDECSYKQACSAPYIDLDLEDDATYGCLLAMAQDIWQDESLHTFKDKDGYGVEGRITGELCIGETSTAFRCTTPSAALLYAVELLSEEAT